MKDLSASRPQRHAAYPKKRPSPGGITKRGAVSPFVPRSSTAVQRALAQQQQQRLAQIIALHQRGVLLEEEYSAEIICWLHEMELATRPCLNSIDQQPEIRWHMRPCLVEFLVEVHFTLHLRPETLYLSMNILDRYLSKRIVFIKHYQLVGMVALWVAAKFEDTKERVPTVRDLASLCKETYDEAAFCQMEVHLLNTLGWGLGHPTAESWMRIFCTDHSHIEDQTTQHLARYLMEITLFYREFIPFTASAIAQGALCLARFICGGSRAFLQESPEGLEVADLLDTRLATQLSELSEILVKKYSYSFYSKAATTTLQFYLKGGRYSRASPLALLLPVMPVTPVRTRKVSTPMSASTSISDSSDESSMPVTPSTPVLFANAFGAMDKENAYGPFTPARSTKCLDAVPDQYLPHDFVMLARPALHDITLSSPRQAVA